MKNLSIYMGTGCNFSCSYCDREYLKSHGYTKLLKTEDIPSIVKYVNSHKPANLISFHGGEPFIFVSNIDKIIDSIDDENDLYFIQTNGSLILDNYDFLNKHKQHLFVSISYDFCSQSKNRTVYDIEKTLKMLQDLKIPVQLQSVIEIDSKFFDYENILEIIRIYKLYDISQLDFITLRDIRGNVDYSIIIDDYTEDQITEYFKKMIEALITFKQFNINVFIDGATEALEENKKYFTKESACLNILSPNGKVYTEYDFLDYDEDYFAVDKWKDDVSINESKFKLDDKCLNCPQYKVCGLKFIIGMFNKEVPKNCKMFYNNMNLIHLFGKYLKNINTLDILGNDFENFINKRL